LNQSICLVLRLGKTSTQQLILPNIFHRALRYGGAGMNDSGTRIRGVVAPRVALPEDVTTVPHPLP
jgi:hypothetical protein